MIKGAIDRIMFDKYIETQLALTLERGDVVILDNLPSHKSAAAQEVLKAHWLLFLPNIQPGQIGLANQTSELGSSAGIPELITCAAERRAGKQEHDGSATADGEEYWSPVVAVCSHAMVVLEP